MTTKLKKSRRRIARDEFSLPPMSDSRRRELGQFLLALSHQARGIAPDCLKFILDVDPQNYEAVHNLGTCFSMSGNMEAAYRTYAGALRIRPDSLLTRACLAEVSRRLGRVDESRKIVDELMLLNPDDFVVIQAKAILEYDLGNFALAKELNNRALRLRPQDVLLNLNEALISMTLGNWKDWWWLYEKTLSYGRCDRMGDLKMSDSWNGGEREGQNLIVIADQGNGDTIEFGRYIPEAKAMGKFSKVTYHVQPDLVELTRRSGVADEVTGFNDREAGQFNNFSSLLGIMRVLQIDPSNAWRPPHLVTDPTLDRVWASKITDERLRVGLVWAGDPAHGNDRNRSLDLSEFDGLTHLDVALYSFQVGKHSQQLFGKYEDRIVDLGCEFRDYDDTASALRSIDLLLSVDTSVLHLAGCLGVPAIAMLPINREWRHMTVDGPSVWYDGVELVGQTRFRDWSNVVEHIERRVKSLAVGGTAKFTTKEEVAWKNKVKR